MKYALTYHLDKKNIPFDFTLVDVTNKVIYIGKNGMKNKIFKSKDQNIAKSQATNYALKANNPKYKGAYIININRTLYKAPKLEDSINSITAPIIDEINKIESDQNFEKNKQELPYSEKAVLTLNIEKETLKRKLIPYILRLLLPFGIATVQAILAKVPLESIKNQILSHA
jgi:hypothetical protein